MYTARAGIVPHLPVPLLIGRDCPLFSRLWNPEPGYRPLWGPPRRHGRTGRPAYGARVAHSATAESSTEDDGPEGDGPTPLDSPGHSTGGTPRVEPTEPRGGGVGKGSTRTVQVDPQDDGCRMTP